VGEANGIEDGIDRKSVDIVLFCCQNSGKEGQKKGKTAGIIAGQERERTSVTLRRGEKKDSSKT